MGRRGRTPPPEDGKRPGMVPEAFARRFCGVPEEQLGQALREYMAEEFGSEHAYLFWLTELATKAERDTVRLDATGKVIELLHGKAPVLVEVKAKKDDGNGTPPVPSTGRTAVILEVLSRVGALSHAGGASLPRGSSHAAVEQVPPAPKRREGAG